MVSGQPDRSDSPEIAAFLIKDCKLYVPVVTLSAEALFVLAFENEADRTSFFKYYVPKVELKDFNVLIDGKPLFEIPVKNKEEAYEAIIEMSKK